MTENKNPNALELDALNEEFAKRIAQLANNPIVNALAQLFESPYIAAHSPSGNIADGFKGPCKVEFAYNEPFEPNLVKFSAILADKLDDFTFKALLTKEDVECTVNFVFTDFTLSFTWDNDIHHFVGHKVVGEMHDEHDFIYNEIDREFVPVNENDEVEEDVTETESISEEVNESVSEDNAPEVYTEACIPVEHTVEKTPVDTSFADQLYAKLNKKHIEDYFDKFKGDLIVALHRIFDYEMYVPIAKEDLSEIIAIRFTLEDVQKVCPNNEIGPFWEHISPQKIVGLVGDEFKFYSVMTYLDPETGNHVVNCKLKNC
jgi:hypothetical protein